MKTKTPTEITNELIENVSESLLINKSDLKNVSLDFEKQTITITIPYYIVEEDNYVGFSSY